MKTLLQVVASMAVFVAVVSVSLYAFDEWPLVVVAAIAVIAAYGIGLKHGRTEASKRLN
jgi:uncharacterized membrane protein YoaK (UPF0700 family)